MRIAYIAHPFSGKRRNIRKVERIIKKAVTEISRLHILQPITRNGVYVRHDAIRTRHETLFRVFKPC